MDRRDHGLVATLEHLAPSLEKAQNQLFPRVHSGVCHGTLGELVQGPVLVEGEVHIGLISLPVKRYSWMHFTPEVPGCIEVDLADKEKCRRAIALYLQRHRRELLPGRWSCDSELLQGKGMASSTADMVATIRCLDSTFGLQSDTPLISAILREVERSDSVFLDTYALYLSGLQQVVHYFGTDPGFYCCYVDEGDIVDTERSGPALLDYYCRNEKAYADNLARVIDAFRRRDLVRIAHCATTSAVLAQGVIPKQLLEPMLAQQPRFHADGIVVAHTGSLVGYLFIRRPSSTEMGELSAFFHALGYQCRFAQTGF